MTSYVSAQVKGWLCPECKRAFFTEGEPQLCPYCGGKGPILVAEETIVRVSTSEDSALYEALRTALEL